MTAEELKTRTKTYAVTIGKLTLALPYNPVNKVYINQIIRCSSSVAANYRASRRAKSKPDFINKLKIVEEELDESLFFLEMLVEFNENFKEQIEKIYSEGEILLRIIVATLVTVRNKK